MNQMVQRLRQDLKRSAWLMAALVVITLSMRWALARGKPERLFKIPSGGQFRLLGVRNDEIIFVEDIRSPQYQVQARNMKSNAVRMIGEDEALRNGAGLVLSDDALYYKVYPPGEYTSGDQAGGIQAQRAAVATVLPPPSQRRGTPLATPRALGGGLGNVAPTGSAPQPGSAAPPGKMGQKVGQQAAATLPTGTMAHPTPISTPRPLEGAGDPPGAPNVTGGRPSRVTLRRLPLSGDPPQDVAAPLARNPATQRDYVVLGDAVYFTRYVPDPPVGPAGPPDKRMTSAVELVSYTPATGKTTVVERVPGVLSMLYTNRTRLFWIVARPNNPAKVDLYHLAPGESRLRVVHDYESWFPPAVAGDRLYWITRRFVRHDPKMAAVSLDWSDLVVAQMEGQDRRIIEPIIENGQYLRYLSRPVAYRDRVYVQVSDRRGDPDGIEGREILYRVRNDLSGLERVTNLPNRTAGRGFAEGGWFYFNVGERRQGWMDYFRDGENLEYSEVLHRLRLPER